MCQADRVPRQSIKKSDQEYLWSESGGHCQNPGCRRDLHEIVKRKPIAELAHIIPASPDGPRGRESTEFDDQRRREASNILLLCPTCHTAIDQAPDEYPSELLRAWKRVSQEARRAAFGNPSFKSRLEARAHIRPLLEVNRKIFVLYGPDDENRDIDRADRWKELVRSTVIPNNRRMVSHFQANSHLLTAAERPVVAEFEIHVAQFEDRHLNGNWSARTIRFPQAVARVFDELAQ